ncbi:TIGR00159 family protein [Pueribacillus theae]|uniref:Diadenylate cyclase n=1 Tax=Pueribacillus theae TaxID=2171751 RepID=A0A2U1JVK8_9BACI|nr:diadenylate cyclase CdaA [Pueribacillus theae]PWA09250.1 TIGR00159 family protein [Pueribacillus theae]
MWPLSDFDIFNFIGDIGDIIDILLVTYVIYKLTMLIRGTKAIQLLKGISVIIAVWFLSSAFQLRTLQWLVEQAINFGFLAIIIIFQPELRRALEQLGRGRFFTRYASPEEEEYKETIDALVKASTYMGKRRIGALISVERETGMNEYVETGIPIQAKITSELLINIFIPNTPLHDGAVIVNKNNILAAACYLPLSESRFISKELGTRHRAAIGISEVTDSLTLVVSEETGQISLAKNGEIYRDLDEENLREQLNKEILKNNTASSRWQWRGKSNG